MVETKGFVAAMQAADAAVKAANVELLGWKKVGSGLVAVFLRGYVDSAKASLDSAFEAAGIIGEVTAADVFARPHDELSKLGCFSF